MTTTETHTANLPATDYLTSAQILQLLKPINPRRVGRDGKGFSHVEAYDVRAHLIRIFGFGRWSEEVLLNEPIFETQHPDDHPNAKARGKWDVAYRALVRLTVCAENGAVLAVYTESAAGDVTNFPGRADAHDMAMKTAQSQAFKRCAVNLGDQFGLSLYNRGSTEALVKASLVGPPRADADEAVAVDEHVTDLAPENEVVEDEREQSTKPEREPRNRPAPPELLPDEAAPVDADEELPVGETEQAVAEVAALVLAARSQGGEEALQTLKQALELAVAKRIRQHRLSTGETVGASLTAMLGQARAAAKAAS